MITCVALWGPGLGSFQGIVWSVSRSESGATAEQQEHPGEQERARIEEEEPEDSGHLRYT